MVAMRMNGGRTYHSNSTYMMWEKDKSKEVPKIHPAQKPVSVLKRLIEIFTDLGDLKLTVISTREQKMKC